MGKYEAYPEYRDSGVEWINGIPEHWNTSYLGFECSVKARLGWKGLKAEEYVDEGYVFLATPNIKDKEIDFINVDRITKVRYDESPEIMLKKGDILVTKDGSTTGTTNAVRSLPEPATVNSSIAVLRSKGNVKSSFLFYYFTSDYTQNIINRMRGGMGVPHLFQADLRKFDILVPPEKEQQKIANFLGQETKKIDTLIEKQQQLIKLLKEKRQAVISHAVTKGLNPDAPMKDSGVEWLGEVPEGWAIQRLKFACEFITQKIDIGNKKTIALENIESWSGKYIATDSDYSGEDVGFQSGDVLFGKLRPYLAKVFFAEEDGVAFGDLLVYRPSKKLHGKYCFYQMINEAFIKMVDSSTYGSKMPRASADFINNMEVLLPPTKEQKKIVTHIESVLKRFDDIEVKATAAISLMQERRTTLISACVTGKINVQNWQAPT